MRSPIAARMTGQADVLVAAKALEPLNGIDIVQDAAPVTYVHMSHKSMILLKLILKGGKRHMVSHAATFSDIVCLRHT